MNNLDIIAKNLTDHLQTIEDRAGGVGWVDADTDLSQCTDFMMQEVDSVCLENELALESLFEMVEEILGCYSWFGVSAVDFNEFEESDKSYRCQHKAFTVATVRHLDSLSTPEFKEMESMLKYSDELFGFFESPS